MAFKISFLLLILNLSQLNSAFSQETPLKDNDSAKNIDTTNTSQQVDQPKEEIGVNVQTKDSTAVSKDLKIEISSDKKAEEKSATTKIVEEKKPENKEYDWIDNSLMLNQNEVKNLKIALSSLKNNVQYQSGDMSEKSDVKKVKEDSAKSLIHMSSILYLTNKNWVIWLNDVRISSEDNDPSNEFYIESIVANKVSIVWSLGITKWKILTNSAEGEKDPEVNENNQIVNRFTLSANQTYVLKTNSIVEGKILPQQPIQPINNKIAK